MHLITVPDGLVALRLRVGVTGIALSTLSSLKSLVPDRCD